MYTRFNLKGKRSQKAQISAMEWKTQCRRRWAPPAFPPTPDGFFSETLWMGLLSAKSLTFPLQWLLVQILQSLQAEQCVSHEAHVAFGFPSFLCLEPERQKAAVYLWWPSTCAQVNTTSEAKTMGWGTWGRGRTPRWFAPFSSAPPWKLPLPVCAEQSLDSRRLLRFSRPALKRQTRENGGGGGEKTKLQQSDHHQSRCGLESARGHIPPEIRQKTFTAHCLMSEPNTSVSN